MSKATRKYLINGALHSEVNGDFLSFNRAFRLGDGFFETIRVVDGELPFWGAHLARIEAAAEVFGMVLPPYMTKDFFHKSLTELIKSVNVETGGRLRLTIYRDGGGAYAPDTDRAGYVAEVLPHYPNRFVLEDKGAALEIYPGGVKVRDRFSGFKVMGNQLSIQAARHCKQWGIDEAILVNAEGRFAETTSGNIFVVKEGIVRTPALSEGGVAGVMRMVVINTCVESGIPIFESELVESDLITADEVFYTNAVSGIKWVSRFRDKRYFHNLSDRLVEEINRRISGRVYV